MTLASLILVKFYDFAKMAFVCEWHGMGYREIYCYPYKTFPIKNSTWSTEKYIASFWPLYQNTSHNNQNLMASDKHFEVFTVCIFDSFVFCLGILDSHKNSVNLQLCDLGILGPRKILQRCHLFVYIMTWSTEKKVAIFPKACPINLFSFFSKQFSK